MLADSAVLAVRAVSAIVALNALSAVAADPGFIYDGLTMSSTMPFVMPELMAST